MSIFVEPIVPLLSPLFCLENQARISFEMFIKAKRLQILKFDYYTKQIIYSKFRDHVP